jgi:uncharacterized membrane protein
LLFDLRIRTFLSIVFAVVVAMGGLIGLAALGIDVPVVRQIVGFILLTLLPGLLILRILRIHDVPSAEALAYSVGLSLVFVMFLGLFMNLVYPLFGIYRPIALYPVTVTFALAILILGVVAYFRDKGFSPTRQARFSPVFPLPYLFVALLPVLAAVGSLLVGRQQSNIVLLILIPLTAAVPVLVALGKIPERACALTVVIVAVTLLYQTTNTLASPFIPGYDSKAEYFYQNRVMSSGYWSRIFRAISIRRSVW